MSTPRPFTQPKTTLDRLTRARIAAHAGVDLRTVERCLAGTQKPHPLTAQAIAAAMKALGVSP